MTSDRLDRDALVSEAIAATGLDDFGEASWVEGLDRLLDDLRDEARLHELGVEVAATEISTYLANRLGIVAWRLDHPEVASEQIEQPIFIVGQPRTGTTILHDLMAQDPSLRAPLTWEVDRPIPPPQTADYDTDPRIDEVQSTIELADSIVPGFTAFHPMGARLAQECVRMTASDFRSLIFPVQYRVPNYNRWLLHDADLGPAYRWHRRYLQHLQSRRPDRQWLLKSPAHLWHFEALAVEYPDAIVVQTHRDPLRVIASISALSAHLRRMSSADPDIVEVAHDYAEDIFVGLDRGMAARRAAVIPDDRFIDVQFQDFVADPMAVARAIYAALGRELDTDTEQRMRRFLDENPGDGGGGGSRYHFADTGLDADALRERSTNYQSFYGVEPEPIR